MEIPRQNGRCGQMPTPQIGLTLMIVKVLEQAEEEDFGMSTLGQVGIDIFTHLTRFFCCCFSHGGRGDFSDI